VAGTVEIGGLDDASVKGAPPLGMEPDYFTVVGDKLLFRDLDATSGTGLWVSDGTAGGTTEIGGLCNGGVSGAELGGLDPFAIGSIGDKALFNGYDASGQQSLWVTDGTAAGTVEIGGLNNAGIKGAAPGGLAPGLFVRRLFRCIGFKRHSGIVGQRWNGRRHPGA
jgi:ELWxxDGT repeat protein